MREKEERGNGCAGGEEEDFERHFLGGGKGAVLDAVCALEIWGWVSVPIEEFGIVGVVPFHSTYGCGVYMPKVNWLNTARYPARGAVVTSDWES